MRRLLFALCLLALPVFAAAQPEALLTPDGTLFTIETVAAMDPQTGAPAPAHLVLRSQHGTEVAQEIVPATLNEGSHLEPTIAYDTESKTLFVFWIRHLGIMSSQLMFACRDANGTWSPAETFGRQFDYRENLRIAVTRKVTEEDGTLSTTPGVSVHVVWWEFNSDDASESAQYAMFAIENGRVASRDMLNLNEFVPQTDAPATDVDRNLLKQPLLFTSPSQDSVLVVFGDFASGGVHQVRIRPTKIVANGRLRVPVGRSEGTTNGPKFLVANERVEGIAGNGRFAYYTRGTDKVSYVIMKDGAWTEANTIALDQQISGSAAVDALRRLVNEH
jgi:hypothetical protein